MVRILRIRTCLFTVNVTNGTGFALSNLEESVSFTDWVFINVNSGRDTNKERRKAISIQCLVAASLMLGGETGARTVYRCREARIVYRHRHSVVVILNANN